ncbi:hypothetical protein ACEWY4_021516 [Coilia grayii]|uniref:GIY-YIG domain-containing protein n=1 Tax=Coilia grayii TaxID=363190 RepID=A0ABD1J981_9TELE
MPPCAPNPTLATFSKLVERDIEAIAKSPKKGFTHNNITSAERKALKELQNNIDIVIKPADKGGAIVIQDAHDYTTEAFRQLNDVSFYKQLPENPVEKFVKERDNILNGALENHWITKKHYDFLKVEYQMTPVFYLLPKIHKRLLNPPGRPIVASKNSLIEPLSQFVDTFIKDIVKTLPSYVADTTAVLRLLTDISMPGGSFLVSFDVEALYTNIPHDGGLEAMDFYLQTKKDELPVEFLMTLTKFILKSNYFMFDKKYFLQCQGTNMGSPFAPNYANLYMGLWEKRHIFNNNPYARNVVFFRRFIDDILMGFAGDEGELLAFRDYINDTYPNLKFTMEYSAKSIHFLDLLITVNNDGQLETSIYRKETDRNTILHASSFHPDHLIDNIPYGQFIRLRRICSIEEDYVAKAQEMCDRFKQRGYSQTQIDTAMGRANQKDRRELLYPQPVQHNNEKGITFVSQYSTAFKQVKKIINKHWRILECDPNLNHLASCRPRFCFKRGKNIRDIVVTSMYQQPTQNSWLAQQQQILGNYRCGRCIHCANTSNTKTFAHPQSGQIYRIKDFINCSSTHVIYVLTCPCGLMYVGQTKRNLKLRIAEHKAAIRNSNFDYAIARHYRDQGHGSAASLRFVGIEKVPPNPRGGQQDQTTSQKGSILD